MFINKEEKETIDKIPYLTVNAGPRDELWPKRLKEELKSLIMYIKMNKANDKHWFVIKPTDIKGINWQGKCWIYYENIKYEFVIEFDIPVTYPVTSMDIRLPELINKTKKMYKGGAICLSVHFKPLFTKNSPKFGIAHCLMLGLAPWLSAEIPILIAQGKIKSQN